MRKIDCYMSNQAPFVRGNAIWIKPTEDGFVVYLLEGGRWKPLKMVNDNQTNDVSDDKEKTILEVADITALTNKQCKSLNVGDQVIKRTGTQKHLYNVTYKDETVGGMCLSYIDAENAETVAYEKSGSSWAYLDTTITPLT